MFGVRVSVAENIRLLYLSISLCILMLCKFFLGGRGIWDFFWGRPPDVPRINTASKGAWPGSRDRFLNFGTPLYLWNSSRWKPEIWYVAVT